MHWPLLFAATAGISFNSVPTATLGLFMEPLQAEFGWSRATVAMGMTVFAILTTPLVGLAGVLIDRIGARTTAVPGLALCGISFAAFSLLNGSVAMWVALWVVYSLCSLTVRSLTWNPPLSRVFVRNRGLAIAILLSGMSVASAFAPLITHTLIENFGWRGGYAGLGIGWTGVALILVVLFFRERPVERPGTDTGQPSDAQRTVPGGLTGAEALRSVAIWRIAVSVLLATLLSSSIGVHFVPVFTSLGAERAEAAAIAIVMGMAGIAGKLAAGAIADRVASSFLPLGCFAFPSAGYAMMLASNGNAVMFTVSAAIVGFGGGTALHMMLYLTTQYAGLRNFGKIYGTVSSLMGVAAGIGPVVAGMIFDRSGSYTLFLMAAVPLYLVAGLSVFGLGPYPDFSPVEVGRPDRGNA